MYIRELFLIFERGHVYALHYDFASFHAAL